MNRKPSSIVILTGAGISAESGIDTFRSAGGLWEQHRVEDVATPEGFARDPDLVLGFYDMRRAALAGVAPNAAHKALARLDAEFAGDLLIVTQNVDDLHERAGSPQVCHMHGELLASLCGACGNKRPTDQPFDGASACPACASRGSLRPDVVWFGEIPYFMDEIEARLADCDLFIAVGTSGLVYPAAGFVRTARASGATAVEVNLEPSDTASLFHLQRRGPATEQLPALVAELLS